MLHLTFRRVIAAVLGAPVFGLLLVILAPLQATPLAFIYDLSLHVAVGAIGVILVAALLRQRVLATLAAALLIAAGWPVAVAQLRAPAALPAGIESLPVRLFWANLHLEHADLDMLSRARSGADITALTEVPQEPPALDGRVVTTGGAGPFDVTVASNLPVAGVTIRHRHGRKLPVMAIDLTLPDEAGVVRVIALHTARPLFAQELREAALDSAIALARDAPEPGKVILLGDLNLASWAPSFARLLDEAGLQTITPRGLPIMTWPNWLLWAGLPIDHILVGNAVGVRSLERGPDIGSDHRPLIAELAVAKTIQLRLGSSSGTNSTANPAAVAAR